MSDVVPLSNQTSHNAPRAIQPIMSDVCNLDPWTVRHEETLGVSYADALQVYAKSLPSSVHASNQHLPTENCYIPPLVQANILIPAQVTASPVTEAQTSSPGASLLPVPDTYHEVCFLISEAHLDDAWSVELAKVDDPVQTNVFNVVFFAGYSGLLRDKRDQEDVAVEEVLKYIQNKAMELATHFHKSHHHYLEHFYIGSALR
ncbi:hypothetical protein F4604DRAFT_1691296 [Suillus subluteus]|nr:hypothetical protein F4604DRAFT_1691296 [Suillus subluteus]